MTTAPDPQAMTPGSCRQPLCLTVDKRPSFGVAWTIMVHTMPFPEASSKYRHGEAMEYRDCDRKERETNKCSLSHRILEKEMEPGNVGAPDVGTNGRSPYLPVTRVSKQAFPKTLRFESCLISVNKTMFPKHPHTQSKQWDASGGGWCQHR